MTVLNELIEYWLSAYWLWALCMSIIVNIVIFVVTAFILDKFIQKLVDKFKLGYYIDNRELKIHQKKIELRNGIVACIVFAFGSLLVRVLFTGIWPTSVYDFLIQIVVFTAFYESYSYFIHRLLHTKYLIRFHAVHHKSIRVTPWSAYNVHPIEAMFIGLSVPLFMLLFPLNLGIALIFHVFGMMFTIFLHSNFNFNGDNMVTKIINKYSYFHSQHHMIGKINFGFINQFWDRLLKTKNNRNGYKFK